MPRLPAIATVAAKVFCCAVLLGVSIAAARAPAQDTTRLRIVWGGGTACQWSGTVAVSEGTVSAPQALGIEADEPGSMGTDPGNGSRLVVRQRSPRSHDGVDLLVSAPPTAKLQVRFLAADAPDRPVAIDIPLTDISAKSVVKDLDNRGNRLAVFRAPSDSLRVRFDRDHLIFTPGEPWKFEVEPHGLSLPKGTQARLKVQLLSPNGEELWSRQHDVPADPAATVPFEVTMPQDEGAWDVVVSAIGSGNWSQTVRKPLNWKWTIAQRRVQVLVLRPQRPSTSTSEPGLNLVVEIDPANPRWYEKLSKLSQLQLGRTKLPRWLTRDGRATLAWKGEIGNDCLVQRRHTLGELVELKPNTESPDVSWEAYWLPINQPGRPHVLEVDYPSDTPQTLGLSIIEPDASGAAGSFTANAGVDQTAELVGVAGAKPHWQHYRLVFWPRSNTPLLLVTNGRQRQPAMYGRIRVFSGGEWLPRAMPEHAPSNRLLATYLDRPLIADNFSANRSVDSWSGRCLDDWQAFYQGGTRLVDYLNHAGYNGLMLAVLADGSTIYPSALLEPTPRYDNGGFIYPTGLLEAAGRHDTRATLSSAQDPVRKDVLELLLRLFDRENLQLIPMVEFATPLPALETLRRQTGAETDGIEWIGPEGTAWEATWSARRGRAPYYNLLNPRVQRAMLDVLEELATRYAGHKAFTGLAVRLSADGYAQLPGPDWGLDDATIGRFEHDTGAHLPGSGPTRFRDRAAYLAEPSHRQAWVQWRCGQLANFYRRAADALTAIRPNTRLYLAGAEMTGVPELEADLRPALPRRTSLAKTLLQVGIDPRRFQENEPRIMLLRAERLGAEGDLAQRATDLELSQTTEADRCFQCSRAPGSFFFHQPQELRIDSFEQKSPFKSGATCLLSQPSPGGDQNRRRFIRGLAATDSQVIVDGGCVLPLGQEDAIRDLAATYRALPAVHFETVEAGSSSGSQPVRFRHAVHDGRAYVYAINDAPMPVTARLRIEAGADCRIEGLGGLRKLAPLKPDGEGAFCWEVTLEAYDLVAVRLSDPGAKCSGPQATWPESVDAELTSAIRRLGARAAALRSPPPLDVVANPGFERPASAEGIIPDWGATQQPQASVQLDKNERHGGTHSAKLKSAGPVACLVSRPFSAPATGRLAISVWLRVADPSRQPPLRLAMEGQLRGRDYYRFASIGLPAGRGQSAVPLQANWAQYVFQVDDLPLDGLSHIRARFDLMGAGEVWLDDVQVYSLAFSRAEMIELSKLIALADVKLQQRQIGDCVRLLEGYWPRFLEEHVPLPTGLANRGAADPKPREPEQRPEERTGWYDRMKDLLPESLRF
ncbi:MAG: hypothetical protein ABFC63_05860 [Thermoguttaceae bacterium]